MKMFGVFLGLLTLMGSGAAFAADHQGVVLTCEEAGDLAGLEDLTVSTTSHEGVYLLSVTVSGSGGFMETYHYPMTARAKNSASNRSFGYVSIKPRRAVLALEDFSAAKSSGKLRAMGPKNAQLWPDSRFDYDVVCHRQ